MNKLRRCNTQHRSVATIFLCGVSLFNTTFANFIHYSKGFTISHHKISRLIGHKIAFIIIVNWLYSTYFDSTSISHLQFEKKDGLILVTLCTEEVPAMNNKYIFNVDLNVRKQNKKIPLIFFFCLLITDQYTCGKELITKWYHWLHMRKLYIQRRQRSESDYQWFLWFHDLLLSPKDKSKWTQVQCICCFDRSQPWSNVPKMEMMG